MDVQFLCPQFPPEHQEISGSRAKLWTRRNQGEIHPMVRSGHSFRNFSGDLPPPLRLVEEDDDLLNHGIPPHMRMLAVGIALLFGIATAATAFFTAGTSSLLVQAGPPAPPDSNGSR